MLKRSNYIAVLPIHIMVMLPADEIYAESAVLYLWQGLDTKNVTEAPWQFSYKFK